MKKRLKDDTIDPYSYPNSSTMIRKAEVGIWFTLAIGLTTIGVCSAGVWLLCTIVDAIIK